MSIPELKFHLGTLILDRIVPQQTAKIPGLVWDDRTLQFRAPAAKYRDIISFFYESQQELHDRARNYQFFPIKLTQEIVPRPHQSRALKAWVEQGRRGVACLPTGSGKTILGVMVIAAIQRPTLIVVPTIDLMQQWHSVLGSYFDCPIGMVGGGHRNHYPVSVSTYDSALIDIESRGADYGLVIFDECHHLPSPRYKIIAEGSIAPFRLGLTATLERADGGEEEIFRLLGPKVYEEQITAMVEKVLAPYDVVCLEVPMTDAEQEDYQENRQKYLGFVRSNRINFSSPYGWSQFIRLSASRPDGSDAMKAYRRQKKIAQRAQNKLLEVWRILGEHPTAQIIVFTDENEHAYHIGRQLVAPVLTHLTRAAERKKMLESFRSKKLSLLITSKVLNEGVDVPSASVGIVVAGSGTVREHVQRLGRILRHQPGKRAVMYEIVSRGTSEVFVNKRRKQHNAYQESPSV